MQISFNYYPFRLQYIEDPDRVTVFKKNKPNNQNLLQI